MFLNVLCERVITREWTFEREKKQGGKKDKECCGTVKYKIFQPFYFPKSQYNTLCFYIRLERANFTGLTKERNIFY